MLDINVVSWLRVNPSLTLTQFNPNSNHGPLVIRCVGEYINNHCNVTWRQTAQSSFINEREDSAGAKDTLQLSGGDNLYTCLVTFHFKVRYHNLSTNMSSLVASLHCQSQLLGVTWSTTKTAVSCSRTRLKVRRPHVKIVSQLLARSIYTRMAAPFIVIVILTKQESGSQGRALSKITGELTHPSFPRRTASAWKGDITTLFISKYAAVCYYRLGQRQQCVTSGRHKWAPSERQILSPLCLEVAVPVKLTEPTPQRLGHLWIQRMPARYQLAVVLLIGVDLLSCWHCTPFASMSKRLSTKAGYRYG